MDKVSIVRVKKEVLDNVPSDVLSQLSAIAVKYKVSIEITKQNSVPTFFTTNCDGDD